ncbi:D-lactate dehydrogenase [Citrobacter koseri]|uniref:D-lactate dehydrogenase n=1 Tax=Citrobacter koseri TaxID=545 RepID=A0A2X2VDT0_CITKO|nr:D-lactate dehydrogenase [Citrobacter koseri]
MSSITTTDNKAFLNELTRLVGHSHLLTDPAKTARYRKGFRSGQGEALARGLPRLAAGIVRRTERLRKRR